MNPSVDSIIWPLVAQALLVGAIWVRIYQERFAEMRRRGIDPRSLGTSREASAALDNVAAADNFRNLFEVPVLFFAVCLALAVTELVNPIQVTFAWMYVGLRAVHSLIHVTYNRVVHRFVAHVLSTLCVFSMWLMLSMDLWRGADSF